MQNKLLQYLLAGFLALATFTGAYASDSDTSGHNRLFGGLDWQHFSEDDGQGSEKVTGNPWGGVVGFEHHQEDDLYYYLRANWNGGRVDNSTEKAYAHAFSLHGRLGYAFNAGDDFSVTPYTGLGYAHTNAKFTTSGGAAADFMMKMHHWYVPVGLFFSWHVAPEFNVGLDLQAKWTFNSEVDYQPTTGTHESSKHKSRVMWSAEVPLMYKMSSEWDLSLVPFYERGRFKVEDTTMANLHDSHENVFGARLEVGYSF